MSPDERNALRAAVDFRRRMLALVEVPTSARCAGCGRELEDMGVTEGCQRCINRDHGRKKRARARERSAA